MKIRNLILAATLLFILSGCAPAEQPAQIAATTLPVYEFTSRLCEGTGLTVTQLVTESVSCLHDYSLNVDQVRSAESAELIVISGAGLEDFMSDLLSGKHVIDASSDITLIAGESGHDHEHTGQVHENHHHEDDPHIWLSPVNAMTMARNIKKGLSLEYPAYESVFESNLTGLLQDLEKLELFGQEQLAHLVCRNLITFHDGFAYLAQSYDLTVIEAVEEESGSEASAAELIHLIEEVEHHALPAVFTEKLGSVSAAQIISAETGVKICELDMAMHGNSYFTAMYHNITTLKGALG